MSTFIPSTWSPQPFWGSKDHAIRKRCFLSTSIFMSSMYVYVHSYQHLVDKFYVNYIYHKLYVSIMLPTIVGQSYHPCYLFSASRLCRQKVLPTWIKWGPIPSSTWIMLSITRTPWWEQENLGEWRDGPCSQKHSMYGLYLPTICLNFMVNVGKYQNSKRTDSTRPKCQNLAIELYDLLPWHAAFVDDQKAPQNKHHEIGHSQNPVVLAITERMHRIARVPLGHAEPLQVAIWRKGWSRIDCFRPFYSEPTWCLSFL